MTTASALLNPTTAIPFDAIDAAEVEPAIDRLLASARERVSAIGRDSSEPTWDNTMGALENATYELEWAMGILGHLESVTSADALRAAVGAPRRSRAAEHDRPRAGPAPVLRTP